jgi:predicted unusual protein kinase regulating ubiquinone biosynthesis (AarF/ABC1/UbiB family)
VSRSATRLQTLPGGRDLRRPDMMRSVRAFFLIAGVLASYAWQWLLVRLTLGRLFRGRWPTVHAANARRLTAGFTRLRGVFIKLGQVMSVLGGFLPPEYRAALEKLQDQVPARPFAEVVGRLEEALGRGALERFPKFERVPLAAASLAQVHKATLADGREVAVKVLYPGIEQLIARDLFVLSLFLPIINRVFPIVRFERVLAQLGAMLRRETDYANECRNMERLRGIFASRPDVVVPTVVAEMTRKGVLTMSFEDGLRIGDVIRHPADGMEPSEIARLITNCYFTMLFEHRVLHADPHPGNFLVRPGPILVILDYGAVEDVSDALARGLETVILGALIRNADQVLAGAEQMGFIRSHRDAQAVRLRSGPRAAARSDAKRRISGWILLSRTYVGAPLRFGRAAGAGARPARRRRAAGVEDDAAQTGAPTAEPHRSRSVTSGRPGPNPGEMPLSFRVFGAAMGVRPRLAIGSSAPS